MPTVGGKKFTYDSKGYKDAAKYAKDTGQPLQMKKGGKAKKGYMHGGMKKPKKKKQEDQMNLLKDLWAHIKEWNEWKMKDWIKAGIVAIVVLFVLKAIVIPGA